MSADLVAYLTRRRDERLRDAASHLEAAEAGEFEARLHIETASREAAEFESRRAVLAAIPKTNRRSS